MCYSLSASVEPFIGPLISTHDASTQDLKSHDASTQDLKSDDASTQDLKSDDALPQDRKSDEVSARSVERFHKLVNAQSGTQMVCMSCFGSYRAVSVQANTRPLTLIVEY